MKKGVAPKNISLLIERGKKSRFQKGRVGPLKGEKRPSMAGAKNPNWRANKLNVNAAGYSWNLKRRYGITEKQFEEILNNQDRRCAICGVYVNGEKGQMCVDHDHDTNKVRGILCRQCNSGIGLLKDNLQVVQNALDYLKKWKTENQGK